MAHHSITVSVGGGHELDRAGLAALISKLPGLRFVSKDAIPPQQILVWNASTSSDGFPSTSPDAVILLLTEDAELESLPEAVIGLLSRDEPPAVLGIAIGQVARGEQYLSPSLATAILQKRQSKLSLTETEKSVIESLTDREREILNQLAQGLSNKTIAARLYLSARTVEGHLATIYSRLGVHSRTEAMLMAAKIPKSMGTTLAPPARAGVVR